MFYNVKMIDYKDSTQVRFYEKPVSVKKKIPSESSLHRTQTKPSVDNHSVGNRSEEQARHSFESSVSRTVNQIYSIARSNKWQYFITLTIDPEKLDNTDYSLIFQKLGIWVNNLKKRYAPDLKYLIVPELHKDKTKWHFHGLFSDVGSILFSFSGKVCVGKYVYDYARKPYATKIYNLPLWKYGFSTATQVRDTSKASSYITKYITKDLSRILANKHRFTASQNIDTPLEKVYNVDHESLEQILSRYMQRVDYVSNVKVSDAGQNIVYMEFNKRGCHG